LTPVEAIQAAQSRIRRKQRGNAHWYELEFGGEWVKVPGVTTVLSILDKPALKHWSANLQFDADILTAWEAHEQDLSFESLESFNSWFRDTAPRKKAHVEKLREAQDHGKQVHRLIENCLRERLGLPVTEFEASDEALFTFSGFKAWAASVELQPLLVETPLASFKHRYAGGMDNLALVNLTEGLTVLDWKTSKAVYQEQRIQSVAYRMQVYELTGVMPKGMLVRLPKDGGEIEPVSLDSEMDDPEMLFGVFKALLSIYPWAKMYGPLRKR
jgi:hypothetical protein